MNRVETAAAIEFVPSRVDGMSEVRLVRVHNDRLELFSAGRWINISFLSFAPGRELSSGFIPIGRLSFSNVDYLDSYFEFFTQPPIRIYMPADGPTQYPDSHFSRIQQLIRAGGFKFLDEYQKELRFVLRASPIKTTLYILAVLAFSWLWGLSVFFPKEASPGMRVTDFINKHRPNTSQNINLAYALPMLIIPSLLTMYHGRNKRALFLMIVVGVMIGLLSETGLWMLINPILPPGENLMWSAGLQVSLLITAILSGLMGLAWRSAFMEPLAPGGRSSRVN